METLHKIAGVKDSSDATQPSSARFPEAPPIPQDADAVSQHGARASVPLNRIPSRKSLRSNKQPSPRPSPGHPPADYPPLPLLPQGRRSNDSARSGVSGSDEEFMWGPSHPCFPHPNPHCAPDSDEAKSTCVIRVKRDWLQAGDLYPQYANLYPEILEPHVTDDDFRFLVSNINARLKAIFNPYTTRALLDSLLGVATGFAWDDLGLTASKQGIKGLEAFVDKWNKDKEREGKEIRLIQLRRTGFMALDFVIPDPGIDDVAEEGGIGSAE